MVLGADWAERLAQNVAGRIVSLVLDSLDLDAVLARIDLDALLARVDVAALMDRVDVDALLAQVDIEDLVKRIDMASTVTGAASGVAEETLSRIRRSVAQADSVAGGWADRLVGRT